MSDDGDRAVVRARPPVPASLGPLLEDHAPSTTVEEARSLARTHFGLHGTVEPLSGERDRNFRVLEPDGAAWVLKVVHPAEPPELSDLQTQALRHIAAVDPSLSVPRIRPASEPARGDVFWPPSVPDGAPRSRVRVYSYLPGTPLHAVPSSPSLRTGLGRQLGRLDRALATFDHPGAQHDLIWDASKATRVSDVLDPGDSVAHGLLAHFAEHAAPAVPALRHQVIHNDANPQNVMADAAGERVAGIIDFGDIIRAPLVQEAATAGAYHLVDGDTALDACLDVVRGYHEVNPLTAAEVEVLFDLVVARLVLIVAITGWRAAQHPKNRRYILRNHRRARLGLERAAGVGCAAATAEFRRLLEGPP